MKKITFLAFCFSFLIGCVFAQPKGFRYQARVGIGQSEFAQGNLDNQSGKLALMGGIGAAYQFNNYIGLYGEGVVVSKGAKASVSESGGLIGSSSQYEEIYRLLYAEVPLMLKLSYGFDNFYIKAFSGPSVNFNLMGTYSTEGRSGFSGDVQDQKIAGLELIETAFVYGAGFDILTKNDQLFSLDFRFNRALSSFGTLGNGRNAKNQYFSIGVGYALDSGKK